MCNVRASFVLVVLEEEEGRRVCQATYLSFRWPVFIWDEAQVAHEVAKD